VSDVVVRSAGPADVAAIARIATATGQHDEWSGGNPAYVGHLLAHGRVVVAELGGDVVGFGAVQEIGTPPVTMLCDLFVDPAAHGRGCGRAMLTDLWAGASRKMTFSSLHANAVPLYTSFGLDAWWPLLYLHGDATRLQTGAGCTVEPATAEQVSRCELDWTGADRTADYQAWAARPGGGSIVVRRGGDAIAAGAVMTHGPDRGLAHLAISPSVDDEVAANAVLLTLGRLPGPEATACVCLPAPHPAVRALLAAGWRFDEFDLFMASDPDVFDPRRAVPSPGQA